MKRALFAAAAGALGALGTAGLMAAAPAQADCSTAGTPGYTPPLTPARVQCVAAEQTNTFISTANPATQINTFLNGTNDPDTGVNDGLGIKDQPATFAASIGDFLNGPRSPE
jgi:hypothetical protein